MWDLILRLYCETILRHFTVAHGSVKQEKEAMASYHLEISQVITITVRQ
jgi:DNA-binding transcriptional regulator WhiA